MNRYKMDLRDLRFLLFELFKVQTDVLSKAPFAEWGEDEVNMVLDESLRFATDVTGPLNQVGDKQGCSLREDGTVRVPEGFAGAWKKLYEAGWRSLSAPAEHGGQEAPYFLATAVEELLAGSNTAFSMYPGLTLGAAELIKHFGSERQAQLYADRMFRGEWAGTMCLTEPHAGSDVGAATTKAVKNEDGTYAIKGTKIYISGGDHDLTPNIVHLVLARIEGAEPGTKGLSLFAVPKHRVDEQGAITGTNDVVTVSLEHKMGINGSCTAVLQFGDEDACIGELVGDVQHRGIKQMFRMMNFARIGVAVQGLSVASSAYLNTLEYAKDRTQGPGIDSWKDPSAPKVSILKHPNIRRDLLDMKAKVEGIRALITKLTTHQDRAVALQGVDDEAAAYHQGQVDLLTPLAKAYGSDQGFAVCERAIQVFGGAGYLQDWPIEQYLRDAKIFSIYEGTNAIQALDLVGRKLGQAGGKNAQAFLGDVAKFVAAHREHPELADGVAVLGKAQEAVAGGAMQFLQWFQSGKMVHIPLSAECYLEMVSELCLGWLLLESAVVSIEKLKEVSDGHPDKMFYEGKKYAALYFARNVLPSVMAKAKTLGTADTSAVDIPDDAFATV
ncbi:MAG: acyl-CoA dehydrogenase [Myxococcota bacterium]